MKSSVSSRFGGVSSIQVCIVQILHYFTQKTHRFVTRYQNIQFTANFQLIISRVFAIIFLYNLVFVHAIIIQKRGCLIKEQPLSQKDGLERARFLWYNLTHEQNKSNNPSQLYTRTMGLSNQITDRNRGDDSSGRFGTVAEYAYGKD